ncbi:MAG: hypothetical protein ABIS20_13470 [Thermoanaerobaculia bacterium]
MPTVPRLTVEVVRKCYSRLATRSPYYVYELGRDAIKGCALRVLRREIQIGARADRGKTWLKVSVVRPDVTFEELEAFRSSVRRRVRELEDEALEPSLREARRMTLAELWKAYRDDYVRRRHSRRSPRTLDQRDSLWNCHLLPLYGRLTLAEFASLPPRQVEEIPQMIAGRVNQSRAWAEGRHTGNHCVAALRMAWEFARRRGWIVKDPLREIDLLDAPSAKVYLEDIDLAAVGVALRSLEELATRSVACSRQGPSLTSLLALRVAIYTGCRHGEELLRGKLSWLRRDFSVPRLEVPRAKGDRGDRHGRFVYLGPDSLRCLLTIPRPEGCDDLVPGRVAGTQLARLTEIWERTLVEARKILLAWEAGQGTPLVSSILKARLVGYQGETRVDLYAGGLRIPVKALRHTIKTLHPRAGIAPDHSRQLLGHEAVGLGERVYLHQHGPSLSQAAGKTEDYVRRLMGDALTRAGHRIPQVWCGALPREALPLAR